MLKKWTVENFKSIYESTPIELAPLTIFAGANSSGKSTIIQSILLTAQTLQSPVHSKSVVLNGHIIRLGIFNDVVSNTRDHDSISIGFIMSPLEGDETILGTAISQSHYWGYYGSDIGERVRTIELSYEFNTKGNSKERDLLQLQPQLAASRIKLRFRENKDAEKQEHQEDEINIVRSNDSIEQRATDLRLDLSTPNIDFQSLQYKVLKPEQLYSGRHRVNLPIAGNAAGAFFNHFLPAHLSMVFDSVSEQARGVMQALLNPRETRNTERGFISELENSISIEYRNSLLKILLDCIKGFQQQAQNIKQPELFRHRYLNLAQQFEKDLSLKNYFQITDGLPPMMRPLLNAQLNEKVAGLREAIKAGRDPKYVLSYSPVPPILEYAAEYVRNYFTTNLKYLGPLRDEPKSVYPLSGTTDPRDVGFKGEHTAAVLDVYKSTLITYIPSNSFTTNGLNPQPIQVNLDTAVSDWLSYMGVVHDLETTDKGKHGHELRVATTGSDALHDLTHVGVGVSQVLPILVLSLLARPDSTLIFEQPELHLHPRVQTRLADFFIAMSMLGKQCIVETHSEYLINRLRYLSAIGKGKDISDRVILYFVEKNGTHSCYRPIRINEFGVIPDWPKGFFDENEENAAALLRAAMEKRKNKIQKPDAPSLS